MLMFTLGYTKLSFCFGTVHILMSVLIKCYFPMANFSTILPVSLQTSKTNNLELRTNESY